MEAFKTVPPTMQTMISTQFSIANLPRVGDDSNTAFNTVQANVSAAEVYTPPGRIRGELSCPTYFIYRYLLSLLGRTREGQIGNFAVPHVDVSDSTGGLTHTGWMSDTPRIKPAQGEEDPVSPQAEADLYDPGAFFFMEIGVGVVTADIGSLLFNGRHLHGGRSPAPRSASVEEYDWPYRLLVVHYSHELPLNGGCVFPWMKMPVNAFDITHKIFSIRPELLMLEYVSHSS